MIPAAPVSSVGVWAVDCWLFVCFLLAEVSGLFQSKSLEVIKVCICVCLCVSAVCVCVCVCVCAMLCPASCLPLLRELAQWRCLLGWHRHHGVGSASAAGLNANTGQQQQQGSEVRGKDSRPVGRTKPLQGSQVSPGPNRTEMHNERVVFLLWGIFVAIGCWISLKQQLRSRASPNPNETHRSVAQTGLPGSSFRSQCELKHHVNPCSDIFCKILNFAGSDELNATTSYVTLLWMRGWCRV